MVNYLWLIVALPLAGAIINGLLGPKFSNRAVTITTLAATGGSFVLALLAFFELASLPADGRVMHNTLYTWIQSGDMSINAGFLLDPLSGLWLLVVTGVGFLIHIYSTGYMSHDKTFWRFFTYLNLFMFSMLMLILGDNYLMLFIGWEGVGLCSYLLIGYDHHRDAAATAGKKAFIMNRIGDFGFILGMFFIFVTFGTLDYQTIAANAHLSLTVGGSVVTITTLLLFLGATGKSAQIPLYTWLPDAMEGPTPVSALIHAATMVTAGIYMLCRSAVLFNMAPDTMMVVAVIGCATAVFAATIGLFQKDIKKVLAYSTVSQLGYMFMAVGVGAYVAAAFHVMTHAFFKACLFLGSGSVIHGMSGEQNMEKMGGLKKEMPITYKTYFISTLAISGIFPFAGFFSKDEILYSAFSSQHIILWMLASVAAGVTAFYMFRSVFMTFHGESRVSEEAKKHLHESPSVMTTPLIILAGLATVGGFLGIPMIEGANVLHNWLGPVFDAAQVHVPDAHGGEHQHSVMLEVGLMFFSLAVAGVGIALAYLFYIKNTKLKDELYGKFKGVHTVIYNKYYIDEIYDSVFVKSCIKFSKQVLHKVIDVSIIDGFVNSVGTFFVTLSGWAKRIQTGYVRDYALTMLVASVLIVGYYMWGIK